MKRLMDFSILGVNDALMRVLKQNDITQPTAIQEKTMPLIMEGKDIIGQAQTGTGKTLAFLLPMIEKVDINKPHVQGLIITPTRELALQITGEIRKLKPAKEVNMLAVYGGQDVNSQIKKLKSAIHIVVGTPGRLLDHVRRKTVDFSQIRMLVLDEADQMLDMGFLPDIEQIIKKTDANRQTMLFSATMPKAIRALSSKYLKDAQQIKIQTKNVTLEEIKQVAIQTSDRGKQEALMQVIKEYNPFMGVIFCRTKRRAKKLNEELQMKGINSDELHGDLSQAKREQVMKKFRQLKIQFLVATDVAARGLDIEGVTHVFNYDIPMDVDSYIHRIGRTGRAGQTGVAVTFVTPKDSVALSNIEQGIQIKLEKRKIITNERYEKVALPKKINARGEAIKQRNAGKDRKFGQRKTNKRKGTSKRSTNKKKGYGVK